MEIHGVQAVFSDIDGTLLDSHSVLREKTKESVSRLKVPFYLASGRFYKMMLPLCDELSIHTPLVSANGGLVITEEGEVLKEYPIAPDILMEVLSELHEEFHDVIGLHLYDSENWYCNSVTSPLFSLEYRVVRCYPDRTLSDMRGLSSYRISKFLLFSSKEVCSELFRRWNIRYRDRVHLFHEKDTMLEMFSSSASKGNGVKVLCDRYGYDMDKVLCAGDTLLDLSMIEKARFSVAMGNACDELKRHAKIIAKTTDEDGLSDILDSIH